MFHSRHFNCERLNDGVFALIAKEDGGAMSNAGLVDMGGFTLIFDTFNTPQAGKDLREAALQLFHQPIGYVINSHWHGDHIRGNQMFPEQTIISSVLTRERMRTTQPQWLARMQGLLPNLEADILATANAAVLEEDAVQKKKLLSEQYYMQEIRASVVNLKITLPDITYEQKLTIHGPARTVEIVSLGRAHTECDSILYSPADSIVFAGDVMAVQNHPLFADGDPHSWLMALAALETFQAEWIVPGHGPAAGPGCIHDLKQYINDLLNIGNELMRTGSSADIRSISVPEAYQLWEVGSIFYRNLEFLTKP